MLRDNATFIIFILTLIFFCDTTSSECTQLTACSCIFKDGTGYNLTGIVNNGLLSVSNSNYIIYFHPCENALIEVKNESTECNTGKGVSLCAHDEKEKKTFSLGTIEESTIEVPAEDPQKQMVLVFHHKNIVASIKTVCCATCKSVTFSFDSPPTDTEYKFVLTASSACRVNLHIKKGLSTGSVLVILFFVFSGLYFIGGSIAHKVLRGATGWEMLPNHEFWCELPSLVRDGVVFAFNCCKADSYQRI